MNELANERPAVRRTYSMEEIRHLVDLWKNSGKTKKHFCEEQQILSHLR